MMVLLQMCHVTSVGSDPLTALVAGFKALSMAALKQDTPTKVPALASGKASGLLHRHMHLPAAGAS